MTVQENTEPKLKKMTGSKRGRVKAVSSGLCRDLALLDALASDEARARGGLGVTQLTQLVQRDKSQVSRALRALEEMNLVERDADTRQYRLGWRLFGLAARVGNTRLLQIAPGVMRVLVNQLGESVHLCVLEGNQVLTVHTEAPKHHLRATGWIGRTMPGYCSSAGRVLLLDMSLDEIEQRFAGVQFEQMGPGQIVHSARDLHEQVLIARELGYAPVREEFEPELVGVSAPVRDYRGVVIAALNVSAPQFRLGDHLDEAGRLTASAATRLSQELGWTAPDR